MKKILLVFCVCLSIVQTAKATAYSRLAGDTLVIGNKNVEIWK